MIPVLSRAYRHFRHIMGTACKSDDLLPLILTVGTATVVGCVLRAIIAGIRYALALNDVTASSMEKVSYIFIIASCATTSLGLTLLCLYLKLIKKGCQVEHRVGVFIQLCLITWILVFCDGRGGWGGEFALFILPPLGVMMDIPLAINLGTIVVSALIEALLLFAFRYDPSVVWFIQQPVPEIQITFFLGAATLPLFMTHIYATSLKEEQLRTSKMEEKLGEILAKLTQMKTDEVRTMLEAELSTKNNAKNELLLTISDLEAKLSTYRPFIPFALINPKTDDGEGDDENDDDDQSSEDDQDIPIGDNAPDGGRAKNVKDDRVGFDGEANVLKKRKSTIAHVYFGNLPSPFDPHGKGKKAEVATFVCKVLEVCEKHKGVPIQVTPNSIILSWNTHTFCFHHAMSACKFALDIGSILPASTILVATGVNFFGTVGNQTLRSPFVCGEYLDLAHRITSLTRHTLGCSILITEETCKMCGQDITARPVDVVAPQWHDDAKSLKKVTLYELLGGKTNDAPQLDTYRNGFRYLVQGEVRKASSHFIAYSERRPGDLQVQRLLRICSVWQGPQGYVRKEIHWEHLEPDEEDGGVGPGLPSSGSQQAANKPDSTLPNIAPTQMPEDLPNMDLAKVKSHFQNKEKELTADLDTGFFSLCVAEDDDEEEETNAANAAEEVSTAVPKTFDDGNGANWHRGDASIGSGAFSNVYLALSDSGGLVAIKCFSMAAKKSTLDELAAEVVTLSRLRHENIVGYVSCAGTPNHFIILMEYVSGGSLMKMVEEFFPLPTGALRYYLHSILRGLAYLHENGITHCDMKPHNVLLDNDGVCKLSDFGSAMTKVQKEEELQGKEGEGEGEAKAGNIVDNSPQVKGTSWYMAPEAARGEVRPANDIWSLGITVLEMCTGKEPWQWRGKEEEFIAKLGKDPEMLPPINSTVPMEIQEFCRRCFIRNPDDRPTAEELLNDQFVAA